LNEDDRQEAIQLVTAYVAWQQRAMELDEAHPPEYRVYWDLVMELAGGEHSRTIGVLKEMTQLMGSLVRLHALRMGEDPRSLWEAIAMELARHEEDEDDMDEEP
jgi:hypothetical protein